MFNSVLASVEKYLSGKFTLIMESMEKSLMSNFPLAYTSLVVENTTQCTAACGMCYQSASPKGSDLFGIEKLSVEVIRRVIRDAANLPTLAPRFHLAGGEAFLDIPSCIKCFETAKEAGYAEISTTTNAYWAQDEKKAARVCRDLRTAGMTRVEISWDAWHVDFIPANAINNCIKYSYENNIEVALRILSTRKDTAEAAIKMIDNEALQCADSIFCSPVMHTGRAKQTIPDDEVFNVGNLGEACHSMLTLTVNASGDVFPCCAGFDQTNSWHFGNVNRESIVDIAENMNSSLLLRLLVFSGAGSLIPIIEDAGIEVGRDFTSLCSLCWSIFSNPEMVEVLRNYFDKFEQNKKLVEVR